jgi:hypothetical protein
MKCRHIIQVIWSAVIPFCLALISITCKESLPVYLEPQNVLALHVAQVEQLNDRVAPPGRQVVHIVLEAENIFDEVFLDSVHIYGIVKVWWTRKPVRYKTFLVSENNLLDKNAITNGKLLLLPGQKIGFEMYWNMRTDDGIYLPNEMNFTYLRRRMCDFNVACADPEEFTIEASISIYDKIGAVKAAPHTFTFIGRVCTGCPPCTTCGGDGG